MIDVAAQTAALDFHPEAFSIPKESILGRQAAGDSFLRGFFQHAQSRTFYCFTRQAQHFQLFTERLHLAVGRTAAARWICGDHRRLNGPGCLFHPAPGLGTLAWQRRFVGSRSYSLCGVTHTTCSALVLDALADLVIAPVQPWDAVICTSRAVRETVERVHEQWWDYLGVRLGATPRQTVQLPVIPLGVNCAHFEDLRADSAARTCARQKWQIVPEEVVALFVGRLSFHAKAHPLPMYLAAEEAARRTGGKIHLVLAGWFGNAAIADAFCSAARAFCPNVRVTFVDGCQPDQLADAWRAADLFVSLSDNIQETFGLSPVEAMAAGLPCIVSDWDGYRDTVRHGADGFRIPTIVPPPGAGEHLIRRYFDGEDSYDRYIGQTSQCVAVSTAACVEALSRLVADESLRRQFGTAAQQRARTLFDWSVVIRQYEELWAELSNLRQSAEDICPHCPGAPTHPLREDPYALFAGYATTVLRDDTELDAGPDMSSGRLRQLWTHPSMSCAQHLLASEEECLQIVEDLQSGPRTVRDLLVNYAPQRYAVLARTLAWMAKADLVRPVESLTRFEPSDDCAELVCVPEESAISSTNSSWQRRRPR